MATANMGKLDNKATEPVKVNRWTIGLLITIAALIGLAPVTFFLGRPQLLLFILCEVALIVGLSLFFSKFQTAATYAPSFAEILLAGLNDLASSWALLGMGWLVVYELVYWGTKLVQFLLAIASRYAQLNADAIAFYSTVVLFGLMIIAWTINDVEDIIYKLYPNTSGTSSIYYKDATQRRAQLLRELGVILLIYVIIYLVIWFFTKQFFSIWFYVTLQFYLFWIDLPLSLAPSPGMSNAAQAISKLLQVVGYQVIPAPRTGESETDPLLFDLDLFAYNSERAFAIEIKTTQQSEAPVEWSVASSLLVAAFALDKQTQELGVKSQKVEPLLVLVGVKPTENLKAFCKEELVLLVPISGEEVIRQILATKNQTDLQGLVHQYLVGIYDVNNDAGFPSAKSSELQGGL